ncbi:uncharacterized protein LOC111055497 isoform X2 [Nilaparvata lugens]|uniref:uncharacterized protein LOC111055497 isoform X2 n=1 Tax=Nilaparvata lugens TaxID=108931 RepID=UPI00193D4DF3|nr:uncharacterized protein LOC111055497 isoform X2 [Nilaparvata lugens]
MIWMKSTELIRKYINLLRYDNGSPVPFILGLFTAGLVLANLFMVLFKENYNLEKCSLAVKDVLTVLALFSCTIKRLLDPEESIRLTKLIEEEYFVDCCRIGGTKWRRIKLLYQEKRKDLESSSETIIILIHFAYLGFILRYLVLELVGASLKDDPRGFPSPLVHFNPAEYPDLQFSIYIFALHSFLILFLALEGFGGYASLWLCVKKIMTDFESIYILLEEVGKDHPGMEVREYFEKLRILESGGRSSRVDEMVDGKVGENLYWTDDVNAEEKLRADTRLIVEFHQNLNRNQNDCATISGFSISVMSFLVALDTCFNIFLMLQNEIFRQNLAELPWIDKPHWFKQSMMTMMTRANVDTQFKPYGIFVLNLTSYKDANDLQTSFNYAFACFFINLIVFFSYHTGQRIVNQNDILRRSLNDISWIDKPHWFKQSLHIMMARANVDTEMKPYGIYVLNYMSFKNIMKAALSFGHFLYTTKLKGQIQQ